MGLTCFRICTHALCGQVIFTCLALHSLFSNDLLSLHPQIERESYKYCVLLRLTLTIPSPT